VAMGRMSSLGMVLCETLGGTLAASNGSAPRGTAWEVVYGVLAVLPVAVAVAHQILARGEDSSDELFAFSARPRVVSGAH
jgi:hypothetical protein